VHACQPCRAVRPFHPKSALLKPSANCLTVFIVAAYSRFSAAVANPAATITKTTAIVTFSTSFFSSRGMLARVRAP
jgi:hypothetical protein